MLFLAAVLGSFGLVSGQDSPYQPCMLGALAPGSLTVGAGYDIRVADFDTATRSPLFEFQEAFNPQFGPASNPFPKNPKDFRIKGKRYCVADEQFASVLSAYDLQTQVFQSMDDVKKFFSLDIGVKVDDGALNSPVDESWLFQFQQAFRDKTTQFASQSVDDVHLFQLTMLDQPMPKVRDNVQDAMDRAILCLNNKTADLTDLSDACPSECFFDFLGEFGTHYVHSAVMGGQLSFFAKVSTRNVTDGCLISLFANSSALGEDINNGLKDIPSNFTVPDAVKSFVPSCEVRVNGGVVLKAPTAPDVASRSQAALRAIKARTQQMFARQQSADLASVSDVTQFKESRMNIRGGATEDQDILKAAFDTIIQYSSGSNVFTFKSFLDDDNTEEVFSRWERSLRDRPVPTKWQVRSIALLFEEKYRHYVDCDIRELLRLASLAPDPPAAPTLVIVDAVTVGVAWSEVNDTYGIEKYSILFQEPQYMGQGTPFEDTPMIRHDVTGNYSTALVTGLVPCTHYKVGMTCTNALDLESPVSRATDLSLNLAYRPPVMQEMSSHNIGSRNLEAWFYRAQDNCDALTDVVVEIGGKKPNLWENDNWDTSDDGSWKKICCNDFTATRAGATKLDPYVNYTFQMFSKNSKGSSPKRVFHLMTAPDAPDTSKPEVVQATEEFVALKWADHRFTGAEVTKQTLVFERRENPSDIWELELANVDVRQVNISVGIDNTLVPKQQYYVWIKGESTLGSTSSLYARKALVLTGLVVPGPVENMEVVDKDYYFLDLTWPRSTTPGPEVDEVYTIHYISADDFDWNTTQPKSGKDFYPVVLRTPLSTVHFERADEPSPAETSWVFRIFATNDYGEALALDYRFYEFKTGPPRAPDSPRNVLINPRGPPAESGTWQGYEKLYVEYQAPLRNGGRPILDTGGYLITVDPVHPDEDIPTFVASETGGKNVLAVEVASSRNGNTIFNSSQYRVWVRAVNVIGQGAQSDSATLCTWAYVPPVVYSSLVFTPGPTNVDFTWDRVVPYFRSSRCTQTILYQRNVIDDVLVEYGELNTTDNFASYPDPNYPAILPLAANREYNVTLFAYYVLGTVKAFPVQSTTIWKQFRTSPITWSNFDLSTVATPCGALDPTTDVCVSWTNQPDTHGSGSLVDFTIYCKVAGSSDNYAVCATAVAAPASNILVTLLTPGTTYDARILTRTAGASTFSPYFTIRTEWDPDLIIRPASASAVANADFTFTISWPASTSTPVPAGGFRYRVQGTFSNSTVVETSQLAATLPVPQGAPASYQFQIWTVVPATATVSGSAIASTLFRVTSSIQAAPLILPPKPPAPVLSVMPGNNLKMTYNNFALNTLTRGGEALDNIRITIQGFKTGVGLLSPETVCNRFCQDDTHSSQAFPAFTGNGEFQFRVLIGNSVGNSAWSDYSNKITLS